MQALHEQREASPAIRASVGSNAAAGQMDCAEKSPRGLLIVGLFKLSKALFFGAVGAGALHMVHHSIGDLVARITDALPIDPEGHFVGMLMDRSDLIDAHQLRQISMASFGYSVLCIVEGTGLLLGKTWAEYFTVMLTMLGLPVELFEIAKRFTLFKLGALVVNVLVLLYLLWVLKRKRQSEAGDRSGRIS